MLTYRPASRRAAQLALEKTRSGSPDLQSVASRPSESCPVPRGAGGRGGHLLWWVDNLVKQSVPTHRPISFRLFLVPRQPHPVLRQLNRRGVNFPGFLGETMCPVPWDLWISDLGPGLAKHVRTGLDSPQSARRGCWGSASPLVKRDPHHQQGSLFRHRGGSLSPPRGHSHGESDEGQFSGKRSMKQRVPSQSHSPTRFARPPACQPLMPSR
jgi:hypothetical protein